MGYLEVQGRKMTFNEYKQQELIQKYKMNGLQQFLNIYNAHKDRFIERKNLHWGEEIEYTLFMLDQHMKKAWLANQGYSLIQSFNQMEDPDIQLQPEFGNWMIEAVPKQPYNSTEDIEDLISCDLKIANRRSTLQKFFNFYQLGLTTFATPIILGTKDHILIEDPDIMDDVMRHENELDKRNHYSQSLFAIDQTENPHPRFSGLMTSIRQRRQEKVKILVPLFGDEKTNMVDATEEEPFPGSIYMDSMHFGMGCSCLQVTFEAQTINHARYIHDQLLPFTPIFAALSANSPIFKGKIADIDMRWTVISQSVDCRNTQERDPLSEQYIPKSRYSSQNHYLSSHKYVKDQYIDTIQYKVDQSHVDLLKSQGLDERMAYHIASLFVRDPIPTFSNEHDETQFDNEQTTGHFENLQSTNWCSMRFKPPPSLDSKIGWRVEFRTMDIQLTDFENSAFIVVLGLILNVINNFDVNFIMPITQIDENMERAEKVDAYTQQKFWFRFNNAAKNLKECKLEQHDFIQSKDESDEDADEDGIFEEMYIYEILEGKESIGYKGIYPLIYEYLTSCNHTKDQVEKVNQYLDFVLGRAKGQHETGAAYQRRLVLSHPDYQKDSIVSQTIAHDLVADVLELACDDEKRNKFYGFKQ